MPSATATASPGAAVPAAGIKLGIWQLAWPSALAFALQSLVGLVDFLIVGTLGGEAVAATGIATQLYFVQVGIFTAVTGGTTAMITRAAGAGDAQEVDRAFRASLVLTVGLGAACMSLMLLSEPLIAMFGVEPGVVALGGAYLSIVLGFSLSLGVNNLFQAALRGVGDVKTPLYIGLVVNLLNALGDYVLVFGKWGAPALGVAGAAYATGFALTVGALLCIALWLSGKLALRRQRWLEGVSRGRLARLLRVGLPSAAEMVVFNVGIMLFVGINARFGTEAVSAYFIGIRILSFSFIPGIAFQVAASTLVGQNLGAGAREEAARAGFRCCLAAVAVMSGFGGVIALFAEPLAHWFSATGPRTVMLTVHFIWVLAAAQPLMAVEFSLGGALRGAGDTRFPLLAVMTGLLNGRLLLPLLAIAVFDAPIQLVWCSLLMDYSIKATMLGTRFGRRRWQSIEV